MAFLGGLGRFLAGTATGGLSEAGYAANRARGRREKRERAGVKPGQATAGPMPGKGLPPPVDQSLPGPGSVDGILRGLGGGGGAMMPQGPMLDPQQGAMPPPLPGGGPVPGGMPGPAGPGLDPREQMSGPWGGLFRRMNPSAALYRGLNGQ